VEDLLRLALDRALAGDSVRAADVRVVAPQRHEHLSITNGEATAVTSARSSGIGVRVRTRRAWGFATTSSLDRSSIRETAARAARVARAAERSVRDPLELTDERGPRNGRYETAVRVDPFEISREEKIRFLVDAERALHVDPAVKTGHAQVDVFDERKWFLSSEGASFSSHLTHVGAGVDATAVGRGEVQRRSGPTSFGGDYRQAGWEFVQSLALSELAPAVGREAVGLLNAPACSEGETTLVLGSDQLALQIHESVGHPTELDRILAMEAGFAGTSWVRPDDVGGLVYGSDRMFIVADATAEGGLGSFGWDDEGVPAQRVPLVDAGRLVGVLSSRETAARRGWARSGGTMRAEGFHRTPLVRMTNVNHPPGDLSFDELLDGVREGVYLHTNRSWSIDDKRLNFQFGTEVGRRIQNGELGELVRNPIYSGMTPTFWGSLDAVGDASTWHLWGLPNCGKGQPGQTARVGHGAPAARFRGVRVRGG
jgi:TldD protein